MSKRSKKASFAATVQERRALKSELQGVISSTIFSDRFRGRNLSEPGLAAEVWMAVTEAVRAKYPPPYPAVTVSTTPGRLHIAGIVPSDLRRFAVRQRINAP